MTATLFLIFVVAVAVVVLAVIARYVSPAKAARAGLVTLVWLIYVGLLGYFGVVKNTTMRPPGIVFLVVPVGLTLLASALIIAVSRGGARIASAFPLWFLMGLQCYRLGVELFLHQLWREGLLPRMLTFAGANVDIYLGATALVAAWVSTKGRTGLKLAFAWNLLGLLALGNVVIRAVLTAPGPFNRIHAEVPDRMIGTFPFLLIPGFFVPLAVILHLLAMRAIHSRFTDRARSRDGAR